MRFSLIALAVVASLMSLPAAGAERPNIIYVMLDDAGYGDLGGSVVKTPTFDRMCDEGLRFTDHYSGSAVCAPTRCVLMTGLSTGHCRRRDNTAVAALDDFHGRRPLVFLEPEDLTVAEVLKQAGYRTGGIGKWGLGNPGTAGSPDKQGFDHFYGYLDQVHAHNYYTDWLWRDGHVEELPGNQNGAETTYAHDLFEKDTLDFIRENKDGPFFLYLPYTLPHGEYEIPEDDPAVALYAGERWRPMIKAYAAMITKADRTVGKMLDLLKELEIDDNTIVFYTSDNGPNSPFRGPLGSDGGLRGTKRYLYEGGIRAQMVVRWPGKVPAGKTSPFAWSMVDVFPTFCDLAKTTTPAGLDGISVLPTLLGKQQDPIEHIYWEIHHPFQQAVRMGKWKGVRFGTEEPLELYDLSADWSEEKNVAEGNPEIVKKIEAIMTGGRTDSRYWPAQPKRRKKQ